MRTIIILNPKGGCGKSTIASIILALLIPDKGEVKIRKNSKDIKN